ncbi:hypothetical protein HDU82_000653 [Entophlyctis luteolus]|nr:hypothetical protein HDU82_000653 [Entophlyctis luteolus]
MDGQHPTAALQQQLVESVPSTAARSSTASAAEEGRVAGKRLTAERILTRLARDSMDDIYCRHSTASSPSTRSASSAEIPPWAPTERTSTASVTSPRRTRVAEIAIINGSMADELMSSIDNTVTSSLSLDESSASSSKSNSSSSLPKKLRAVDIRKQLLALGEVDSSGWNGLRRPSTQSNASDDRSLQELKQEFLDGPAIISTRNKDVLTVDRNPSFEGSAMAVNAGYELQAFNGENGHAESPTGSTRSSLTYAQRTNHLSNLSPRPSAAIDRLVSTSSSTGSSSSSLECASARYSNSSSAITAHRIGSKLRAAEIFRSGGAGPRDSLDFLASEDSASDPAVDHGNGCEGSAEKIAHGGDDNDEAPKMRRMSSPTFPIATSFNRSSSSSSSASFDEATILPATPAGRSSRLTASEIIRKFAKDSLENLATISRINPRKNSDSGAFTSSDTEDSDDVCASSYNRPSPDSTPCSPQVRVTGFDGTDLRRGTSLSDRQRPDSIHQSAVAAKQSDGNSMEVMEKHRKMSIADLKKEFLEGPAKERFVKPSSADDVDTVNVREKYRTHSKLTKPLRSILKPPRPPSNFDPVTLEVTPSDGSLSQVCSGASKASVGNSLSGSCVFFGSDDDFGSAARQTKVKWIKYYISDVKTFRKDVVI